MAPQKFVFRGKTAAGETWLVEAYSLLSACAKFVTKHPDSIFVEVSRVEVPVPPAPKEKPFFPGVEIPHEFLVKMTFAENAAYSAIVSAFVPDVREWMDRAYENMADSQDDSKD